METQRGTVMDECSHEVLLLPPLLPGNLGMHATASSELASQLADEVMAISIREDNKLCWLLLQSCGETWARRTSHTHMVCCFPFSLGLGGGDFFALWSLPPFSSQESSPDAYQQSVVSLMEEPKRPKPSRCAVSPSTTPTKIATGRSDAMTPTEAY